MIDISQYINCVCHNDKRNEIVCEEKKSKYILHNNSQFKVEKVKVDNCLPYFLNEKKCDYLLRAIKNNPVTKAKASAA